MPGAALFPGVRALFIGKVTTNRRASRQVTHSSAPQFAERYIGIDYSGAEVATASLKGHLISPWENSTVFLHPEQRQWVERDYAGPARVAGSAGTGKTLCRVLFRLSLLYRMPPSL